MSRQDRIPKAGRPDREPPIGRNAKKGMHRSSLADLTSTWLPMNEETGLYPPLNMPVPHIIVDNKPYPRHCPENFVKKQFDWQDSDILVATYPRSGTALTLSICRELHLLHDPTISDNHHLRHGSPGIQTPWINSEICPMNPEEMPLPRVFKTHNYYEHIYGDVKMIHVYRDPKDAAWSLYKHTGIGNDDRKFRCSFTEFAEYFLEGLTSNGCWWEFNRDLFYNKSGKEILHISYKEMTQDKPEAIRKINRFMGFRNLDDSELESVASATSIKILKPGQVGKPGKSLEVMTVEQRRRFCEKTEKEMDGIKQILPKSYYCE